MARGFDAVNEFAEKISKNSSKKKEAKDYGPSILFASIEDGATETFRFLEEGKDVYSYFYHDFSDVDEKNGWRYQIPCLDQEEEGKPCPGCEAEKPRKFQGLINVIWRNSPVFKRDADGVFEQDSKNNYIEEGKADQVAVLRQGVTVFKRLGKKDVSFKGLGSRDFDFERSGVKLDTEYSIEPNDPDAGPVPLTDEDKALAADKYDLEKIPNWRNYEDSKGYLEFRQGQYDGEGSSSKSDVKSFLSSGPFSD